MRQRLDSGQIIVEPEVEIDALHFAVGNQVGPGPDLVVNREPDRVAQRLAAVVGAEPLWMGRNFIAEMDVPAGKRPTPDDGRGDQRQVGHARNLSRRRGRGKSG